MSRRSPSPSSSSRTRYPDSSYRSNHSNRDRDEYDSRDRAKDTGRGSDGYRDRYRSNEERLRRDRGRDEGADRYRRDGRDREDRDRERGTGSRKPEDRDTRRRYDRIDDRGGPSRRSLSPRPRPHPSPRPASPRPRSSRPRSTSPPPAPAEDKSKPNFGASGLLAAATKTVKTADGRSTLLKYNEPPEARTPAVGWRLYVFKGAEQVDLLHIHRQSAYLVGRDRAVVDIAVYHPSCSKQHAVIQFRYVPVKDEFGGTSKGIVKPFVIDLESTNGTHVNDETIPTTRYYELKAGDVLKFGTSQREYVLLHDEAT